MSLGGAVLAVGALRPLRDALDAHGHPFYRVAVRPNVSGLRCAWLLLSRCKHFLLDAAKMEAIGHAVAIYWSWPVMDPWGGSGGPARAGASVRSECARGDSVPKLGQLSSIHAVSDC